jgi:arginyl-tRNA synthetase
VDAQKQELAKALAEELPLDEESILALIIPCKRPELGDISFPCFTLAKSFKKNPVLIAKELAEKFTGHDIGQITAAGPYLNIKLNESRVAKKVLTEIFEKEKFGSSMLGDGKTIVIDYSSPNIAKPFGIGHLRSTVIGRAIKNLYQYHGYKVIGINHLGDWGTQFGLMIAAWNRWSDQFDPEGDAVEQFYRFYVDINRLAREDESIREEARDHFRQLEAGDETARERWEFFRSTSLAEFQRIYSLLGVEFDYNQGEAFYNDKMAPILEKIEAKGLTEISDGALIVDLDKLTADPEDETTGESAPTKKKTPNLGKVLLRKGDGATLYATRDLTAAYYRAETFKPEKILYVVGMPQKQHFQQFFKVVELMEEPWAAALNYVGFGHYLGMSTRSGTLVFLNEVLERTSDMARQIAQGLKSREQIELSEDEVEIVAKAVGIGAVIFFDLKSRRAKDLDFDWERLLNLKGDTGPYVQWTFARCSGILRKNDRDINANVDFSLLNGPEARELFKTLSKFPIQVEKARDQYEPSLITTYLIELSRATNAFIHVSNVIKSEDALRNARALVIHCTRKVIGQGLDLLGIAALEKM